MDPLPKGQPKKSSHHKVTVVTEYAPSFLHLSHLPLAPFSNLHLHPLHLSSFPLSPVTYLSLLPDNATSLQDYFLLSFLLPSAGAQVRQATRDPGNAQCGFSNIKVEKTKPSLGVKAPGSQAGFIVHGQTQLRYGKAFLSLLGFRETQRGQPLLMSAQVPPWGSGRLRAPGGELLQLL